MGAQEPTGCLCFTRRRRKGPQEAAHGGNSHSTEPPTAQLPPEKQYAVSRPAARQPLVKAEAASSASAPGPAVKDDPAPAAPPSTTQTATFVVSATPAAPIDAPPCPSADGVVRASVPRPEPSRNSGDVQLPLPPARQPDVQPTAAASSLAEGPAAPAPSQRSPTTDEPAGGVHHDHRPALHTLSASSHASSASHASTAYFSAGGWSHFGDDGEWIGPPHARASPRPASAGGAHSLTAGAAAAAAAAEVGGGGGGVGGQHLPASTQAQRAGALEPGGGTAALPAAPHGAVNRGTSQEPGSRQLALPVGQEGSPPAEDAPQPLAHAPSLRHDERVAGSGGAAAPAAPPATDPLPHAAVASASAATAAPDKGGGGGGGEERSALLDRVAELYVVQGRPCKACQVLLAYCRAQGVEPASLRGPMRERQLPDAEGLTKLGQSVSDALSDLSSEVGWQVVRDDELRLLYRHLPERGVHAFRAHCDLDAPTEHLIALTREVDLAPTWNKYCTSGAVLQQRSLTDVTAYMSLWVPWPFNDVGFCVDATGADLYDEEGRLVITFGSRSMADGGDPLELPPAAAGHRRIRLLSPSCLSFTPLPPKSPGGPSRTRATVQCYVDPGLRNVPPFIISFVLKVMSPFMYGAVKKVLASAFRSADGPMPQRVKQRAELYDMVKRRTQEYLARQATVQQQQQQRKGT